ncbi:dimethylsulfonioproprionate lyase family protein [Aestuariivirga sp.]|uniref:dimethylsulfonioproprionate lyase family protein n=1 Tax=Aestuariivirga sp. TaxID=2650926 RepID=UPI003BAD9CE0
MDNARRLLHTPVGLPGSGRIRYGAAMALFAEGVISEAQLDAYREASAYDGRDPAVLLRDRRLVSIPAAPLSPQESLAGLFDAASDYVTALSHPGAAEVRAGLSRRTGNAGAIAPKPHPVVERWLEPALQVLEISNPQLAHSICAAAPHLAWASYDRYPRSGIGEAFADGHAYAPIMGEGAAIGARDFELGLFLIAPNTLYRDHRHAAPELYAPLTGPHGWRFGPGRPVIWKPAHEPVWNPSQRPHLTKTGGVPFLCFYVWTADVHQPAEILPADDWAALEA